MHGRGVCMAGGVHGRGHTWWGACVVGVCMAGSECVAGAMHGRGCVWQEGMHGKGVARGPPADTMRYSQ